MSPPRILGAALVPAILRTDEVARETVRLVVVDATRDAVELVPFARLPQLLRAGDLVVVNDAATLPASLVGRTADDVAFELRLTAPLEDRILHGVLLGAGDHRTRTEHRAAPPELAIGSRVRVGAIAAQVTARDGRRVVLLAEACGDELWQALYTSGAPVQYAHRPERLPLWAVQTSYATRPWAAEMPSAGRPLTWEVLVGLRRAGIALATLTHAAGLSSTGDDALDRALPWPERYEIPTRTAHAIAATRARGGRVIAIGTTVVRALEASRGTAGAGVATVRLDPTYAPTIVDGIVSGIHTPGESHFELLAAFAPRPQLLRATRLALAHDLASHELGDACLVLGRGSAVRTADKRGQATRGKPAAHVSSSEDARSARTSSRGRHAARPGVVMPEVKLPGASQRLTCRRRRTRARSDRTSSRGRHRLRRARAW